ncbi:MAG: hypothetical protein ACFWUJ_17915 [Pseudomonas fragi]|jgi:hypothetical protein
MQRLVRVFSDVFMPILPALIIAGLLMGVNNLLGAKGMFIDGKTLLDALSATGRGMEPDQPDGQHLFRIPACPGGWSAAKRFGGSEILGIVLGLMLVHPDLLNAWNYGKAVAGLEGQSLPYFNILGLFQIEKVGYQGADPADPVGRLCDERDRKMAAGAGTQCHSTAGGTHHHHRHYRRAGAGDHRPGDPSPWHPDYRGRGAVV